MPNQQQEPEPVKSIEQLLFEAKSVLDLIWDKVHMDEKYARMISRISYDIEDTILKNSERYVPFMDRTLKNVAIKEHEKREQEKKQHKSKRVVKKR